MRKHCDIVECRSAEDAQVLASSLEGARVIGDLFVLAPHVPDGEVIRIDYRRKRTPCLQQEPGLVLRIPWEKADLLVARRLRSTGDIEEQPNGDLVLRPTADHVKDEEDCGLVAAQLEAFTEAPLAARYRVALCAWAGDVPAAGVRKATLVRFSDAETCEAILEFPELACHVEGRLGLYTLVIREGQLNNFKKKLRAHDLDIRPVDHIADPAPPQDWAVQWVEQWQANHKPEEKEAPAPVGEDTDREERVASLPSYSPRIVREILEEAIDRRKPVLVEYETTWSSNPSVRRVDPVSVDMSAGVPTLSGYCHKLGGPRTFKLARISGIRVLEDESF